MIHLDLLKMIWLYLASFPRVTGTFFLWRIYRELLLWDHLEQIREIRRLCSPECWKTMGTEVISNSIWLVVWNRGILFHILGMS